ncbi:ATP-binding cassette domain-containing protein [Microbacterium oxydans]|uniref:ATP-binding cassette domain-containing protein n=1 Tax=Microbacterium oxydans TaxID=82380 RepID=UPI00366BF436
MPEGQVLEFTHVTKRFNEVTAVSDFSARVEPGAVTAFLGPNGAGKTTTLRILLGQVRATSGTATIGGTAFAELRQPLRTIGSVLEETVYRPRRTAERQLTIAAKANGIPLARVGEVLSLVGLEGEGGSRIGGFSLGMRQRLSVAHALLGDPGALVFDEPANGLDPEGIRWMRLLMRRLADEGRTVLVSSHVLSEVEQVADNVLVLSKGTLVLSSGIETLADPKGGSVIVDAADRSALTTALQDAGFDIEVLRSGLTVRGGDAGTVGAVAADAGIALSTLVQRGPTLEDVFIDLMRGGRFAPSTPATPPQLAATAPEGTAAEATASEDITSEDTAAEVTTAEVTASEDTAPEGTAAENAAAGPAPADSVVAIPVAAAAAWAAEAAAAPAGEAPVDDLAASVDTVDRSEHTSDEPDAPSSDASASTDEAPAPEVDAEHAPADQAPSEESPERSFDEILFGAAAPAEAAGDQAADPANGNEHHSGVEVFADLHDAPESTDTDESDDQLGAGPTDDDALASTSDSDSDPDTSDDVADATADEEDPRSAAVSSMLAAAARAYYEDEPRDYPLSAENQTPEEQRGEGSVSDEGAHWTVASTGVIDTVPLAASTDSGEAGDTAASEAEEPSAEESLTEESLTEESLTEESPTEESSTEEFGADEHGTEQSGTADAGEQSEPHDEHRHDEHRHDEHRHDEHGHG